MKRVISSPDGEAELGLEVFKFSSLEKWLVVVRLLVVQSEDKDPNTLWQSIGPNVESLEGV